MCRQNVDALDTENYTMNTILYAIVMIVLYFLWWIFCALLIIHN